MLTMMLAAMDTTIVSTAIPQIVGDLGGFALFSWVFSIYLLTQTVTIPIYGKLADMFGRKPVLLVGTLIFLGGSVASALAWNMVALIAFRGLQGLGAGSIMATVNTLAGDLYSARERARVQGWLSSVWGVASIAGPTLGGAFAEYASWRWIFLINVPIGGLAIMLISRYLHEKIEPHRHRIDYEGATLMLLAVGALLLGLLQGGQAWPWWSSASVGVFGIALLLVGATVWAERRAAEPVMPGWLWRHPVPAFSNLAMIGMGLAMMGPNTYLPTFGQSVLGLGAISAGLMLACLSIGWPLASALSGHLYLRIGYRDTALAGAVLSVLAAVGFLWMPYPGSVWIVALDQTVLGAGFGLLSTPLLVGVQSSVPWQLRGVATGANMFSRYLGQTLGAAVFGAIFNAGIAAQLVRAPAALAGTLPRDVNAVIGAMQGHKLHGAADSYLHHAMFTATHQIYVGATVVTLLVVVIVLFTPRRFAVADGEKPK